jgi:hypothetical protein
MSKKTDRIKKKIASLKEKIAFLEKELHNEFAQEAIREVESWRPDLRLMLGPPPKRVKGERDD